MTAAALPSKSYGLSVILTLASGRKSSVRFQSAAPTSSLIRWPAVAPLR